MSGSQATAMRALQGVLSNVRGARALAILALSQVLGQGHEDLRGRAVGCPASAGVVPVLPLIAMRSDMIEFACNAADEG